MPASGKLRSLLATARLANIPSVISNVWAGIAIGAAFQRWEHRGPFLFDALSLIFAGIFLYVSGNFLNDWHDREWDVKNRPERALPRGLFPASLYLTTAILLAIAGLVLATLVDLKCGIVALLIVGFIVIYTRWHKKAVWPVIPMGLCRALLPIMGFVGFSTTVILALPGHEPHGIYHFASHTPGQGFHQTSIILAHAAALLLYIAALSLGARYESSADPSKTALAVSKAALICSGLLAAAFWFYLSPAAALIGLLPFAIWLIFCLTKYRHPIPVHVSALLAGIPLIDWIALLSYGRLEPVLSYAPALRPCLIACLIIPPLCFIAGRLLQRLAPAT